jgi:hypothetical protein
LGDALSLVLGFDALFDDALRIAMDYLERTGQAAEYTKVQSLAAATIVAQWRAGARHKIRLANHAINAVEKDRGPKTIWNLCIRGLASRNKWSASVLS